MTVTTPVTAPHGPSTGTGRRRAKRVDFESEAIRSLRDWKQETAETSHATPASWYTSPDVFELECRQLFATTWHIVGHADKLASPGDYFTVELLGLPIIVNRDRHGEVHAISNVCRHRAAPVTVGEGNSKFGFSCLYHGWSYNHDGTVRSCSGMDDAADFDVKDIQLPTYDVRVWEKWVFVAPAQGAPDFDEWIETTAFRAARYNMGELEFHGARRYVLPINWKLMNDANHESYHVPFVHPGLVSAYNVAGNFGVVSQDDLRGEDGVERGANMSPDVNGYTHMASDISGELLAMEPNPRGPFSKVIAALGGTADYRKIKPPLACLEGRDQLAHYFLFNWPGLSHFHFMPDGLGLILLVPIDHQNTEVYVEWWMPKVEKFDERLLQAALIVFGNQILDEDGAMTQLVQHGLESGAYDTGRLAPTEEGLLFAYNDWYIKQLQAGLKREEAVR
ncbi:aromatic ring-hydroxylating dioxygenase subunit alpha [Streptomyces sp. NBC_00144]|uniref:aromatic ring-hydroxylating oxygenase subunit alpha n=1 Tax=Streptomyces sp. NBC_00144 TaxID=2975665 RepID=UPI003243B8CC